MLVEIALTLAAIVSVLSLLLFAFARRHTGTLPLQSVFLLTGLNYGTFFYAVITGTDHTAALTIGLAALEGPALWWLVSSKVHESPTSPFLLHTAPAFLLPLAYVLLPATLESAPFILVSVSRLSYAVLAGILLWKIHKSRSELHWLLWVAVILAAAIGLSIIKLSSHAIFYFDNSWHAPVWLVGLKTLGASGVALALMWWALTKPEIYLGPKKPEGKEASNFHRDTFNRFLLALTNDKLYLDENMNVAQAAERLAVLPRELSESINRCAGKSFKAVLREHRVKFASDLINNPANDTKKMLEIALASGFATKSVFNAAFKTETGITPTEFRKLNRTADL